MNLSETQEEIVKATGNLVVNASAGTGKTKTLVSKIEYEFYKDTTHKVIAAITFTIKAANEIKERLKIDTERSFIGTNNSFVMEEIIRPFIKDVYKLNIEKELTCVYDKKLNTFEEGVALIKNENVIYSYKDNYKNFIFKLGLYILKNSEVCRLYIKSKYFKMYIDEYQDCDRDMHNFFMYICEELDIELFLVGDNKQSIYIWRGADPNIFLSLKNNKKFKHYALMDNFRSCPQIQNYSNLLFENTSNLYDKHIENKDSILYIKTSKECWFENLIDNIDIDTKNKIAILVRTNNYGEELERVLKEKQLEFIYIHKLPIDDITDNSLWFYICITKYFIIPQYSIYNIICEIPNQEIGQKNIMKFLKDRLDIIKTYLGDEERFISSVKQLAISLGLNEDEMLVPNINKLYDTIKDEKYHNAFKIDQLDRVILTCHKSKGLEFDQVIIFSQDYDLEKDTYLHYVAVTRAKHKLIIINIDKDKYEIDINNILNKHCLKLNDLVVIK